MKRRRKVLLLFLSMVAAMIVASLNVSAEEIQTGKEPAAAIQNSTDQTKASVAKPKIKAVYNGNNGMHIKPVKRSDVYYYVIYRRCTDDNVNRRLGWFYGYYTDIVDSTVKTKWGKTYSYTLVAYDHYGHRSKVSDKVTYVRVPQVKVTDKKALSNTKIKVQWKPIVSYSNFSGCEVQYAKYQSHLKNKTGSYRVKTIDRGAFSRTLTGLTKGTNYYIRVRAFKKTKLVTGKWKKCYGPYSTIVRVKTKSTTSVTKYRALLIGNSNYIYADDLSGPPNDIRAMTNMLSGYHFYITRKSNLTGSQIVSAIRSTFIRADSNDVSLFYYSGHGAVNSSKTMGYLSGIDSSGLSMSDLAAELKKIPGKVVVVLDSCNSGNAVEKDVNAIKTEYSPEIFDRAAVEAFAAVNTSLESAPNSEDAEKNGELRNSKFLVLAAGRKNENTYDVYNNWVYGGLFTRYFVQGAGCSYPSGNYSGYIPSDTNNDRKITLKEMYTYTARNVFAYNGKQHVTCYPYGSTGVILKK